jgi:hypothetical protein
MDVFHPLAGEIFRKTPPLSPEDREPSSRILTFSFLKAQAEWVKIMIEKGECSPRYYKKRLATAKFKIYGKNK